MRINCIFRQPSSQHKHTSARELWPYFEWKARFMACQCMWTLTVCDRMPPHMDSQKLIWNFPEISSFTTLTERKAIASIESWMNRIRVLDVLQIVRKRPCWWRKIAQLNSYGHPVTQVEKIKLCWPAAYRLWFGYQRFGIMIFLQIDKETGKINELLVLLFYSSDLPEKNGRKDRKFRRELELNGSRRLSASVKWAGLSLSFDVSVQIKSLFCYVSRH